MENVKKKLMRQISDAAGNVLYTYDAHWVIVNRLRTRQAVLKITQICFHATNRWIFGIGNCGYSRAELGGFTSAIASA